MAADASPARFRQGDLVTVRVGSPPTHFRTPEYIQGKTGVVLTHYGEFRNPESLAHGGDGLPRQPLYRVEFRQTDVWADYRGLSKDKIQVDIYDHWLERASA